MEPEKSSDHTLPPGTNTQSPSGVTTPDLMAEEKDEQQSYEQSVEEQEATTPDDAPAEEYPTGKRLVPILLALVAAVFLVALDMTIIGTAIPKITDEFDGLNMVSWYGSVYFMTYGGFQPASGKFFKYFPLKASFLGAIFIFMVGSLICAVSQNSTTFVIGRAFAGVGAAGVATGAFTIVAFAAEPKPDADNYSFYLNLPVGGLSGILLFLFFKTPPQAITTKATWKEKFLQMDPLGVGLVMAGIISFILAVEYGGQKKPWDSSTVIGLFVGFVLIWIAFVVWEYFNHDRAMLQRRLLVQRFVWMPSAFQCFFAASYFVLLYYLPIYFQSVDNRTAISSGVLNLPLVLAMAVGSMISGTVVSKTGHAAPFMVAGAVMATISAGLMYTFDIGTSMGKWIGYQLFYGAACGLGFQMGITIAQANAKMEDMSSVTATVFFFQTIGGAFSVSAAQSGFVNRMVTELAKLAPEVNPQIVIGTGATQIRHAFPANQVPAIVLAYMAGIKVTFALVVGLVGFTCLLAVFVPRKRLHAGAQQGGAA
ncbi:MFS general substrate transporter [Melanomma pulvis-pyrius CBS 109.77]|uniref:MFS general substrate transporter n=1 Tax=Melanomma pulvis-pyrius CBS 109.77 TaxID=1314802 RepID=A0A6A6XV05_9PLEO|nr:MFS general substrate transporter [Melanomma pulvis-pyrius CBS 109.77]